MKTCFKCEIQQSLSEFSKRRTGHHSWCKTCNKQYHHEYFKNNPERRKTIKRNSLALRKKVELKLIEHLKANPCPCGETNILTLQFDHLRDKKFEISLGICRAYTWEKLKVEIDKCQVLCANCHIIKTSHQVNNWKVKWLASSDSNRDSIV